MSGIVDAVLRAVLTAAHHVLKATWFVRRPKTYGAHALAITPEGRIVLVKLRYAPGWRLPGGGRDANEDPVEAALRELREEIGLASHGQTRLARDFEESTDFKHDTASLVVVRDVRYRPRRWGWEVEQVGEFDPDGLPDNLPAVTARWIEALHPLLRERPRA